MYIEPKKTLLNGRNLDRTIIEQDELIKYIENIDINSLTHLGYYNLLSKICEIKLVNDDYIEIAKQISNFNDCLLIDIKTNMKYSVIVSEGHKRDFSWWDEDYLVGYTVLSPKYISTSQIYDLEEILEKVKKRELFIITNNFYSKLYNDENGDFYYKNNGQKNYIDVKEYREIPFLTTNYNEIDDITFFENITTNFNPEDKNFNEIMKYIRKRIPQKKLLYLFKKYLVELEKNIVDMINIWVDDTTDNINILEEMQEKCNKLTKNLKNKTEKIIEI